MFAIFTPAMWQQTDDYIADPSGRTVIVSLVNAHGRPCRLALKADQKMMAAQCASDTLKFGSDVFIGMKSRGVGCHPHSFQLESGRRCGECGWPAAAALRIRRHTARRFATCKVLLRCCQTSLHCGRARSVRARVMTSRSLPRLAHRSIFLPCLAPATTCTTSLLHLDMFLTACV